MEEVRRPHRLWHGKQLAVGLFGRHRPATIELTWGGIVRVRSRDDGEGVVAEALVEDLASDVEVLPRKSAPSFNAIHLSFPPGSLRGGAGGLVGGGGIVRIQLDGGRLAEEEARAAVNSAMSHRAERKVQVHRLLSPTLELRHTAFDHSDPSHLAMLHRLWTLTSPLHPPPPAMPSPDARKPERDWRHLGFQRADCPQSDFRAMGMLGLRSLVYYAERHTGMVGSLIEAYNERKAGYPFAAAGINVVQVLVQMLVQGVAGNASAVAAVGKDEAISVSKSRLFLVVTRLEGGDAAEALYEAFCASMNLIEQLWVRHEATYLMFNRILRCLRSCLDMWVEEELGDPTGTLEGLRSFDVTRAVLEPDPMDMLNK